MNTDINTEINAPVSLKKKIWTTILSFLVFMMLVLVARHQYYKSVDPYNGTVENIEASEPIDAVLTADQAKADIDYVIEKFRTKHPAWLEEDNTRDDEVEARYTKITSELGDTVTVFELYKNLKYMISPLHDGHSYIGHNNTDWKIIDDLSYAKAYGYPIKINGESVTDIAARYLDTTSYEVESAALEELYMNELYYDISLMTMGVDVSNGVVFTYDIDGVDTDIHHDFVSFSYEETEEEIQENSDISAKESEWVYYEIDEDNNAAIFTLKECNYDDQYKVVLQEFFDALACTSINNVIIDLRGNLGGNSQCATAFLRYIDVDEYKSWDCDIRRGNKIEKHRDIVETNQKLEPLFGGRIWVLTDRYTYSSAMDFAMLIKDNNLGKVVGEASSNLPDSYGDCLYFQTPNAKLFLSVSFKHWYRIDKTKAGEQIMPDYECDPEYALEKVYEVK